MAPRVLLSSDDPAERALLDRVGRALGLEVAEASSATELKAALALEERPACLVLEAGSPALAAAAGRPPEAGRVPWLVLAHAGDADRARGALRAGAVDVLLRPLDPLALELALRRALRLGRTLDELDRLRADRADPNLLTLGRSAAARRLHEQVQRIGRTPRTTVLISGEVGTDIECVARAIHAASAQGPGPFLRIDCGRLEGTAETLERELSLTAGGTLYLSEIADLPLALQGHLADTLEHGLSPGLEGSGDEVAPRVVASTHRDIEALATRGRFREDLLYRLNVLTLAVPPLRERAQDAPDLARHLLDTSVHGRGVTLAESAASALAAHSWPGNDRELACVVERAALLAAGAIEAEHLGLAATGASVEPAPALPLGDRSLKGVEEALIRRLLDEEGGNRSRVARILGVNRTTLYNKLRAYGIDEERTAAGRIDPGEPTSR